MKTRKRDRDGVFIRCGSYWISFIDSQGRRKQRKLKGVTSLTTAKSLTRIRNDAAGDHPEREVQAYLTDRLTEVAVETARKEFFVLSHMLSLAVDWELIPANVAQGIELPKAPAGRIRYLQPTELRTVLAACPEWLRPIAGLLAFTGMRRSEVLGLRWLDIDRKGERIMLPQTKNGDARTVWLNGLACDVIDSLKPGVSTNRLFDEEDITPENVSLAFLRACRKVKINDFRLHDLRHTAASWLRMSGAGLAGRCRSARPSGSAHDPALCAPVAGAPVSSG